MIKAILTDIEGTTSSIGFVKDVLFPYAQAHLPAYVHQHAGEARVREQLEAVAQIAGIDANDTSALVEQLQEWIKGDQKITPLKTLQGFIWREGYQGGDFTGHVYADAVAKLKEWHAAGLKIYIYSSGSVEAQQQIFGHSQYGDLTGLFDGYFDTQVGSKKEIASYHRILTEVGVEDRELLFLSDAQAELDAASDAGLKTCCLLREEDVSGEILSQPAEQVQQAAKASVEVECFKHPVVSSFTNIHIQNFES